MGIFQVRFYLQLGGKQMPRQSLLTENFSEAGFSDGNQ